MSALFTFSIFCGLSAIYALFALTESSMACFIYIFYGLLRPHSLWLICCLCLVYSVCIFCGLFALLLPGLSTPSTYSSLYDLSAVCASFTLSASFIACSIYVFYGSFYLFLHCKSQSKIFMSSMELIHLASYPPWIIPPHHLLYLPSLHHPS